jgi:hypothetical protein
MTPWAARLEDDVTTATLDYTVHFRANLPIDYGHDLAAIENRTRFGQEGVLAWDVAMWGPDGRVLCLARQQAVILDR